MVLMGQFQFLSDIKIFKFLSYATIHQYFYLRYIYQQEHGLNNQVHSGHRMIHVKE